MPPSRTRQRRRFTRQGPAPSNRLTGKRESVFDVVKRLLVGRPLRSERLGDTLLPKWLALPVFCSDPISSVAYATEQILLTLAVGGAGALSLSTPVAAAVAIVLIVVVAS